MGTLDIAAAPESRPAGITCEKYVRGQGKRCANYLDGGACALSSEFMCVEWLKANGGAVPRAEPKSERPVHRDLFGAPVPETLEPSPKVPSSSPMPGTPTLAIAAEPLRVDVDRLRGLTSEDIESFKALGLEVCLETEGLGELWLVPAYTGRDRRELAPEHVATILRAVSAFPGARVVAFASTKPESSQPEESLSCPPRSETRTSRSAA